jgi:hypothetical protein
VEKISFKLGGGGLLEVDFIPITKNAIPYSSTSTMVSKHINRIFTSQCDTASVVLRSLLVPWRAILPWAAKNSRNLQTSTKCLVEQHTSLEFRHKWKPGKECNWSEQEQAHNDFVTTSKCLNWSPKPCSLNDWLACLCNLVKMEGKLTWVMMHGNWKGYSENKIMIHKDMK